MAAKSKTLTRTQAPQCARPRRPAPGRTRKESYRWLQASKSMTTMRRPSAELPPAARSAWRRDRKARAMTASTPVTPASADPSNFSGAVVGGMAFFHFSLTWLAQHLLETLALGSGPQVGPSDRYGRSAVVAQIRADQGVICHHTADLEGNQPAMGPSHAKYGPISRSAGRNCGLDATVRISSSRPGASNHAGRRQAGQGFTTAT